MPAAPGEKQQPQVHSQMLDRPLNIGERKEVTEATPYIASAKTSSAHRLWKKVKNFLEAIGKE